MSATNLNGDDRLHTRAREDQQAQRDAGAGWVIPGEPYLDGSGWDFDSLSRFDECPDPTPRHYEVDATLVVGKFRKDGRLRTSSGGPDLKRMRLRSFDDLEQMREATGWSDRMKEGAWSPDPFAYGSEQAIPGMGGANSQYLPLWPGPVTRQLYWQDYFAMSAKAFEAYNHDPISWRCIHMKQEFALGKGLEANVTFASGSKSGQRHDAAQKVWDEFWERNNMDSRLDIFARDLSWGGEQFLRYFSKGRLTTIRSLDPASIYDLITDPEDHETVFAYHQQFQAPYQLYPPTAGTPSTGVQAPQGPTQAGAATRFIIRQILPQEIDHYRINVSAYERRGRSDLFPALGWIKRLRDYLTAHVIRADLISRICWDLEVAGNQAAVMGLRAQLFPGGQSPPPGTVFGHNSASKLTPIVPSSTGGASTRGDPVLDALVTMISNSIGLPKDWLGFGLSTTRSQALTATEPAARSLEELQGTLEQVLHDIFTRVMTNAKINDADVEYTFPSIATEDRSQKLQDLSYMEANGWLSKATASGMAAKEIGITSYDFDEEQSLIAEEFPEAEMEDVPDSLPNPLTGKKPQRPVQGDGKIRRSVIVAANRQVPKLDITKSPSQEDEPPGLLVPTDGSAAPIPGAAPGAPPSTSATGAAPAPNGTKAPAAKPSRAGFPADQNPLSGAGAKNIRTQNEAEATFTVSEVKWMMRERRKRPDDPEFLKAQEEFRKQTAANLDQLIKDATG